MSPPYARGTEVPPERSRGEIERTLTRYGATGFAYGWQADQAVVAFEVAGRSLRFELPLPSVDEAKFRRNGRGVIRTPAQRQAAYEAEIRRLWRALALAVKAKLEVVASGIATFEEEFLAYFVVADGRTIGESLIPQLEAGVSPRLQLPGGRP